MLTTSFKAGDAAADRLIHALTNTETRAALFLDVDGTLLDIAPTPDAVVVPDTLHRALDTLHHALGGALALVSGRPVHELDQIFAPLKLPAAGAHGAHWRAHRSAAVEHMPDALLPDSVRQRLLELASSHPDLIHEDKGSSFAIHYRNQPALAEPLARSVQGIVATIDAETVSVLPGKAVLEIKRSGFDKAVAVRTLMTIGPFAGRRPVFIGDDVTDRVAIDAVAEADGLALSVERPIGHCHAVFPDADAVRSCLAHIARLMEATT